MFDIDRDVVKENMTLVLNVSRCIVHLRQKITIDRWILQ